MAIKECDNCGVYYNDENDSVEKSISAEDPDNKKTGNNDWDYCYYLECPVCKIRTSQTSVYNPVLLKQAEELNINFY